MMLFFSFLASCLLLNIKQTTALPFINNEGRPVVDVDQGRIIGINVTQEELNILAFKGIPYAEPPVGVLRFMPPVPAGSFEDDLDASNDPHSCPIIAPTGREDCLFVNVYTPDYVLDGNGESELVPVMVWIHGGAWIAGKSNLYSYVYPLVSKDVIVVTMQYRIGILGFFSTDDSTMPGNQGLKDQTLALQWVSENIAQFGGNPDMVTLFGQSAGAASTHYQMLSPHASGLFHRAIMMSGNALDAWAYGRDFYNTSREIAASFDCPLEPVSEMVVCLQKVNFIRMSTSAFQYFDWNFEPFIFGPRVDGDVIPDEPAVLVRDGLYHQVPTIVGTVRDEWALVVGDMFLLKAPVQQLMSDFNVSGPASLQLLSEEDPALMTTYAAYDHYMGGTNITKENSPQLCKLFTDDLFTIHHDWFIQAQTEYTTTYIYQFDHRGQNGTMDSLALLGLDLPQGADWISHADDIPYIFGPMRSTDPDDLAVRDIYSELFANFGKYGDPTPDSSLLGFEWPPTTGDQLTHLSIQVSPVLATDERRTERQFWESLPIKVYDLLHPA